MLESQIEKAAQQYGAKIQSIEALGSGLIHNTYKVRFMDAPAIVLQNINRNTFTKPQHLISNYQMISNFLDHSGIQTNIKIPALIATQDGTFFWIDAGQNFWRATEYIEDSYAPALPENNNQIKDTAACFAAFTKALSGLEAGKLSVVIPDFHNLSFRYRQFTQAIASAPAERLQVSAPLITALQQRHALVLFFNRLSDEKAYPVRVMHHDCKISNVLFNVYTDKVIGPVDFDTIMPGRFFSDVGDMIRSMACTADENETEWDHIKINAAAYGNILEGYLQPMQTSFTPEEKQHIHYPGLIMIYMQALRFITDFLNKDRYYQVTYEQQNFDRAYNQLVLLQQLEAFLKNTYGFTAVA